jgi:glycosyltransferase involved in cell wall biosynthesis
MHTRLPVSLIIPLGESANHIRGLLHSLARGQAWPQELLIVCASCETNTLVNDMKTLIAELPPAFASAIRLISLGKPLFPGEARNEGISHSNCEWLAFLDANTIPSESWLSSTFDSADEKLRPVVVGSTRYVSSSWKQLLFIQATYGQRPLSTLPGTVVHRTIMNKVGGFLPSVRAGEDTDWLMRLHEFGINAPVKQISFLTYRAVPSRFFDLIAKWFRNYSSCAPVVFHLETQKTIYFIAANCMLLYVAFRWNELVAGWRESSLFYVDNVTKYVLFVVILLYLLLRGLIMPVRRGSSLTGLIPLRWLSIGVICFVLDVVKLFAFLLSPRSNRNIL